MIKIGENKRIYISNILWSLLGKLVNIVNSLFVGILVAKYIGPEQYGIMNYVISVVSLFTILSNFGLDNIEVRELSKQNTDKKIIMGTAFFLRLLFATIATVIVLLFVIIYENDLKIQIMIMIYSLSMFFSSFNIIRNYFTSQVLNKYVVKSEIYRTILGAILKIILVLIGASLIWFVIVLTFDFILVASGYLYSYKKKYIKEEKKLEWKYNKTIAYYLIKQSFPLLLSGAAVIIYQKIDQVMIGNMIDKTSVGYFSTACKFTELILYLPSIISSTLTPKLVFSYENDKKQYIKHRQIFSNIIVWFSIITSVFVSLSAYWLIYYTFGKEYLLSVPVLQIMAYKAIGMALASSSGTIIVIENLQKYAVLRNIAGCIICITLNLILIPMWGIIGSALVTIITVFVSGYLIHILIEPFREIFFVQTRSLFIGWKDIPYIIKNLNK